MAISDRIIAWYSGSSTSDDHGSNTLTANGTSPGYVSGKVGNAFDCDATNTTYWSRANADCGDFQLGLKSQSVAFWVYINALPATNAQLVSFGGNWQSGLDDGYGIHLESTGKLLARFSDGTTWAGFTSTTVLSISTWYHVVLTCDRSGLMRVYVNGIPDATTVSISTYAATSLSATRDLEIGGNFGAAGHFDGLIDEVLFYDGVLSGDLRFEHRNGTTGVSYSTFTALTRPFVSQEFIHEQESNTTHAEVSVDDSSRLIAGQIAVGILATDGNTTSPSVGAWDGAWTLAIDGGTPNGGSQLVRTRVWWKTVTATDVSTETEFRVDWTTNEKAVLIFQLWDNCVGMNAANESDTAAAQTVYTESGVTTTVNGCHIIVGIGIDGGTTVSSVSPAVDFYEYQVTASAGHVGLWLGGEYQATLGATGSYEITDSASAAAVPFSFAMEPVAAGATVSASATDGAVLGDTPTNTLTRVASALDGVVLSDAPAVAAALQRAVDDGLSLSDVAAAIIAISGAATDGLTFGDSLAVSLVRYASVSDGISFTDTAVLPTDAAYAAATVTLASAIAASVTIQAAISAAVTIKPD